MKKIQLNIQDAVADTLFIPLYGKAIASQEKTPVITDPVAVDLFNRIDYDFEKYKGKRGSLIGSGLRANYFDMLAKDFILSSERPIVVNVGCGLDARYQRIGTEVTQKAVFYELDLAEVIAVREDLIPCEDNQHFIISSMFETKWMDELLQKHPDGDFIFIIEGVMMYFSNEENKNLFIKLAQRFPGAMIHFDTWNKFMSKQSKRHDVIKKTKATFQFGIDDDKEIESWAPNLKHQKTVLFGKLKGSYKMGISWYILMNIIPIFRTSFKLMSYKIEEKIN